MLSLSGLQGHDLDLVGSHDLGDKSRLVDDEASLELLDALTAGFEALLQGHLLLVVLVEDRVDEVASVAVGALGHLLECTHVVHPVELGLLVDEVPAAHEDIDLEGAAGSEGLGHLGAQEVSSGLEAGLEACAVLHELQVAHHQVRELVAVRLLTCRGHDLVLIELHDLVIIMLQSEDGTVDGGVGANDHPILAADAKSGVHVINQKILFYYFNQSQLKDRQQKADFSKINQINPLTY